MHRISFLIASIVWCAASCQAIRAPLSSTATNSSTSAFECGKPMAPCGQAIPAGVTCPKGPGYCQSGHYCGSPGPSILEPPKCLPLPKDCGTAGNACCPSNTDTPHTSEADKLRRKPFCKDGSTCFFVAPTRGARNGDIYAATTGRCTGFSKDCGLKAGSSCCPMPYHMDSNPPLQRFGCPVGMFCNPSSSSSSSYSSLSSSTCEPNPADCGQIGKRCCVFSGGGSGVDFQCGSQAAAKSQGPKAYCGNPPGYKDSGQAPWTELVCLQCPEKLDPELEKTNLRMYYACKTFNHHHH